MKTYDKTICDAWKDEIEKLLIFAGLFSATVTAFTIESYQWLQEDYTQTSAQLLVQISAQLSTSGTNTPTTGIQPFTPTARSVRINAFWFLSLVLSLSTVVIGILCNQWLKVFLQEALLPLEHAMPVRQMRFAGFHSWGVPEIIHTLPVVLQWSVLIFFAGVLDLLWSLNRVVAAISTVGVGITTVILLFTTFAPFVQLMYEKSPSLDRCPYKSPLSWLFLRAMINIPLRFILKIRAIRFRIRPFSRIDLLLKLKEAKLNSWPDVDKVILHSRQWHKGLLGAIVGDIDIEAMNEAFLWTLTRLASGHNYDVLQDVFHCLYTSLDRDVSHRLLQMMGYTIQLGQSSDKSPPLEYDALLLHFLTRNLPRNSNRNLLNELRIRFLNSAWNTDLDQQSVNRLRIMVNLQPGDLRHKQRTFDSTVELGLQKLMCIITRRGEPIWSFSYLWLSNLVEFATYAPVEKSNVILHRDTQKIALALLSQLNHPVLETIEKGDKTEVSSLQASFVRIVRPPPVGLSGLKRVEIWEETMNNIDGAHARTPVTSGVISVIVDMLINRVMTQPYSAGSPTEENASKLETLLKSEGYWPHVEESKQ
ncbi:hypothetical protein AMATHDRAFT_65791 [Amanita thiersii Skay4041]|uniref:DUF6535 domain-containing protein n=1 Tax=Amanita thiersii Skay4041 TaxID=703135 RepID=A0A2A9NBA7_9AGAR|nr:hypothetical protein AMATHDRAFT_65791 [Amanita thiersii Skay4041]